MAKTVAYYLDLPYTIELRNTPGEGWFVRVKELPGCMSQGDTAEEALAMVQDAMQGWLEVALEYGDPIPEPRPEEEFSGKFVVRVPRTLHRELVVASDREGVSLNQFINTVLAQAVGRATPSRQPGWPAPSDALGRVLGKVEKLTEQLELALAGRTALPDARAGQGFGYRPQQPAQLAVHEGGTDYEADAALPDTEPDKHYQPDVASEVGRP